MAATEKPKPTTIAALQRSREIVASGPSGHEYKIRQLNLERHALAGNLPAHLRRVAMQGAAAVNKLLEAEDEEIADKGPEVKAYLDELVLEVIVEPELSQRHIDEGVLPAADWRWALNIALGEEDRDGQGRLLWGREPLSRWDTFRHFHGCSEDCEGCTGAVGAFSALLPR